MVNATTMVGAARRLAKKKGWKESASDSDSDSGTGKARAPGAGVVRALHHLITWLAIHSPGSGCRGGI